MNAETDTETVGAPTKASEDLEKKANDESMAAAAAASGTTQEAAATSKATVTPFKEPKVSAGNVESERKPSGDGCHCQGPCLLHSCSCFVEGKFCDPINCQCCAPASVGLGQGRSTSCHNNDKTDNIELRKSALVKALHEHPEAFWGTAASSATAQPNDSASVEVENSSQAPDPKILTEIQDLVKEQLLASGDDIDIDNSSGTMPPTLADLNNFQYCLEKLAKDEGNNGRPTPSKDLASVLLQATAKDVLTILDTIKRVRNSLGDSIVSIDTIDHAAEHAAVKEVPNAELQLLQCAEEFPDKEGLESDGSSYYNNLDKKTKMYTNAGNSNNPLVKSLICKETGFFDGDDAAVPDSKDKDPSDAAELKSSQQLALVLATTHSVRAKTLELAKKRLKRQRVE